MARVRLRPACVQCGKPVPYRFGADGGVLASLDLLRKDEGAMFCRLRCAANYGFAHAYRTVPPTAIREHFAAENRRRRDLIRIRLRGE